VIKTGTWTARLERFANGFHARRASPVRSADEFVSRPEPRTIGSSVRGRRLIAGEFLFAGHPVTARDTSIWDLPTPGPTFTEELHGFVWLGDLAAVGNMEARRRARDWTTDWIARFGGGKGPGWFPALTGRRVIRWIDHALLLLESRDRATSGAYFRVLGKQTTFLERRWKAAPSGLPRFEALTGLIRAGLTLRNMEYLVTPTTDALSRECEREIGPHGDITNRNPEELLEILTLLTWAATELTESGRILSKAHTDAIRRIVPRLRALRHSDGSLARFHGGGRGTEGELDRALAVSGIRKRPGSGLSMGYARLSADRTSVIVDAAAPPMASRNAHASTLAFELTSGRRPVVVNCGSGAYFGPAWRRAGRATPSHSTLGIDGISSSRFGGGRQGGLLSDRPALVVFQRTDHAGGIACQFSHDGYGKTHGLIHERNLFLSADGRMLEGGDVLAAQDERAKRRLGRMLRRARRQGGIAYAVRFHLHPDVEATADAGGTAVAIALGSGEIWMFRHNGPARLSLEPSVYLEAELSEPCATKQIVLSTRITGFGSRMTWSLAKTPDTPTALRDLETSDPVAMRTAEETVLK